MIDIDCDILDTVERYAAHKLRKEELFLFEEHLKEDLALVDMVSFFSEFEVGVATWGGVLFKEELKKIEAEME